MNHSQPHIERMMTIRNTISEFIEQELIDGSEMVDDDEMLLSDGVVDSLGMVRLVGYLEQTYELEIPPQDFTIEHFRSITTITNYIERLVNAG